MKELTHPKDDFQDILTHFESVQARHTKARQLSLQSRSLGSDGKDEQTTTSK